MEPHELPEQAAVHQRPDPVDIAVRLLFHAHTGPIDNQPHKGEGVKIRDELQLLLGDPPLAHQVLRQRAHQRVGELGRAFKMNIVAYDPYLPAHVFEEQQATSMGIDELLKVSDFVTIHMPLTPETKDLFNAKSLAEMKDDAVVLNMARGGIVNEQDMYEALKAGKIGGYASDVMENELAGGGLTEGAGFDSPLFECENFLVSPHLGAQSTDASRDIGAHIIAKVKEALNLG